MVQQLDEKITRWQATGNKIDVTLSAKNKIESKGHAYIQLFSGKTRLWRACKRCLIILLASLPFLFIPGVHFLIALGLVFGLPVVFAYTQGQKSTVLGGHAICPNCQAAFEIAARPDVWPLSDICTECSIHVTILKR